MKTKFDAIVRLRKKDMQECELTIMENENKIASKRMQLDEMQNELMKINMPLVGTFYAFMAYEEMKKMILLRIQKARDELEKLFENRYFLQTRYQKCHIEYEKMAFLEKREQDEILKKIKMKEKKEADEIAMMIYNNMDGKVL